MSGNKPRMSREEELALIELVSRKGLRGSALDVDEANPPVADTLPETAAEPLTPAPVSAQRENDSDQKRRRVALPPFDDFLTSRPITTKRYALYFSEETHAKVSAILKRVAGDSVTISNYVENIVLQHFEQYRDEINTRNRQMNKDNLL